MTRSRALVLGGTGYVGAAVVRGLSDAGLATAFTYHRSSERARALSRELGAAAHAMDLEDAACVRRVIDEVCAELGVPDVLICCATCAHAGRVLDIDDELFARMMRINVCGVFTAVRELARRMLARSGDAGCPGGEIVLTAGPDATMATPSSAHFAASQLALVGLARATAAELGTHGLRVNVVAVGVLEGGAGALLSSERRAEVERYSALGRIGRADEVARAILWMALENPYLNGVVVPVTGGL